MIDISKLKIGDKVHYQPKHYKDTEYENGMVKEIRAVCDLRSQDINELVNELVWVVYHCDGEWGNIKNYTGARTELSDLKYGWRHDNKNTPAPPEVGDNHDH